jgi:hypothetical protein
MKRAAFVLAFVLPGLFVWLTSAALPPLVASHFSAGGAANGFMARASYVGFMAAIAVVVPLLMALSGRLVATLPEHRINLPNRDYWLAPQRKASTVAFLRTMCTGFAAALAFFLCFVHWLVVRAQAVQPPRLEEAPFYAALAAFGVAVVAGLLVLVLRFRRAT